MKFCKHPKCSHRLSADSRTGLCLKHYRASVKDFHQSTPPKYTDEQLLEMLHLRDVEGFSAKRIADNLNRTFGLDMTRNSVIGSLNRINADMEKHGYGRNLKPLGPKWWMKGINAQKANLGCLEGAQ